jgi:hypothetical protein
MKKSFVTPDFPRPKRPRNNSVISKKEQKYFIAYVAYGKLIDNSTYKDVLNDILFIDEEITSDLLDKIESSLLEKINSNQYQIKYFATQIFNIVKI